MLSSHYNSIKAYLANGNMPSSLPSTVSNFRREASKYRLEANGELSRQGKRVALYKDRMKIFNALHQHAGRDTSWKKIKERYYWRGGQTFVAKKVSECVACAHKNDQLWKATLPKLKAISVKPKAFWRVHIDLMGPLTQTLNGNSYVGLAVCALTKYVEAAGKIALKNQNFFERVYTLVIQTYCNTPPPPKNEQK